MWKIAENVYADYLRKKTRSAGRIAELDETVPDDGPYSLVNGGGGRGVVWGKDEDLIASMNKNTIRGIWGGISSDDGRGTVIAMNFARPSTPSGSKTI